MNYELANGIAILLLASVVCGFTIKIHLLKSELKELKEQFDSVRRSELIVLCRVERKRDVFIVYGYNSKGEPLKFFIHPTYNAQGKPSGKEILEESYGHVSEEIEAQIKCYLSHKPTYTAFTV